MQLLLLLVVILAFVPYSPAGGPPDPLIATGVVLSIVAVVGLLGESASRLFAGWLRRQPERRGRILVWYHRYRIFHGLVTIAAYVGILFGLAWGTVVRRGFGLADAILVDEILILLPYLVMVGLGWLSFYRVESTATAGYSTPPAFRGPFDYLWFHVRHYAGLVLAPILLFTGIYDVIEVTLPGVTETVWFQMAAVGCLTLGILLVTPWLLTMIWQTEPLPAGPLRHRLESAARRLGFKYTDILLWHTRSGLANAMVTGVFRFPRYVLLSDGLVEHLQPEEVEAVFGHEIGHIKHHHMPLYLGFMVLSLLLLGSLAEVLLPTAAWLDGDWSMLLTGWPHTGQLWTTSFAATLLLGAYIWLAFGFLSRRCERQADIYGCKAVSCPDAECESDRHFPADKLRGLCRTGIQTFVQALERVAHVNGIRRDKPSWRHSSIARRVAFLRLLQERPDAEPRWQRQLWWVKCTVLLTLVAAVVALQWYATA